MFGLLRTSRAFGARKHKVRSVHPLVDRLQFECLEPRLAPAFGELPQLVSGTAAGTATGNGASNSYSARTLSANGRYQVFDSNANNLPSGVPDSNASTDVYVRDLWNGTTSLVSVNSLGTGSGNNSSSAPTISADGRYVAFVSSASDLTSTPVSAGNQVYRRDLLTNTTVLASVNSTGAAGMDSGASALSISANGNRIAYQTNATDVVAGIADSNAASDVYARDVAAGVTYAVSVVPAGNATGNLQSTGPVISEDGSGVTFTSAASNLTAAVDVNAAFDVFLRYLNSGTTHLVSRASLAPGSANRESQIYGRSLSDDGRYEVFSTRADDVVPGLIDNNNAHDVFVRDLQTNAVQLVSANSAGTGTANDNSTNAVMSGNGRYVVYESAATNLPNGSTSGIRQIYRWDRTSNATILVSVNSAGNGGGNGYAETATVSADGNRIAYISNADNLTPIPDAQPGEDAFLRDVPAGTTTLLSVNSTGSASGNDITSTAIVCADGSAVVLLSEATDLVGGIVDENNGDDVFLRNLGTSTTTLISVSYVAARTLDSGAGKNLHSLSADGRYQTFVSNSANVVAGLTDANGGYDVFVRDLVAGTTRMVSVNSNGTGAGAGGESFDAALSANGRYVAFVSTASNLTALGGNGFRQIYRRDLLTNVTVLISANAAAGLGNDHADNPTISDNGGRIAFHSLATNAVAGIVDGNGAVDVLARDVGASTTYFCSVASSGTASGNGLSQAAKISGDGSTVVFESTADNLIAGAIDNNLAKDVFARNLSGGTTNLVSAQVVGSGFADRHSQLAGFRQSSGAVDDVGRFHVFVSYATNLVANVPDRNGLLDAFLHDTQTGAVTLVTVNRFGTGSSNAAPEYVAISGNGQYVFFQSTATDLVAGATNGGNQLYRWNRLTGSTELVSVQSNGTALDAIPVDNLHSDYAVSDDGNLVAFATKSQAMVPGLTDAFFDLDIFVRNMSTGTTICASVVTGGAAAGNGDSRSPEIAANGSTVVFVSEATDLVALADNNGIGIDVFHRNLVSNVTTLVSVNSDGTGTGNQTVQDRASLSDDGNRVAFASYATDMIAGGTAGFIHSFVRDVIGAQTILASQSTSLAHGNQGGLNPQISGNGLAVVFQSNSTNLAAHADTNGAWDVFLRNLSTGITTMVSRNSAGNDSGNGESTLSNFASALSSTGDIVAFHSEADDLVAGFADGNFDRDVYVRRMSAGVIVCANRNAAGTATPANYSDSFAGGVSATGGKVVFASAGNDMLPAPLDYDRNQGSVFSLEIPSNALTLISKKAVGTFAGHGFSDTPFVSADGQRVLFRSDANGLGNFTVYVASGFSALVLRDRTTSTTEVVSTDAGNEIGFQAEPSALTPDGRYALFTSFEALAAGANPTYQKVYRRDTLADVTAMATYRSNGAVLDLDAYVPAISADGNIIAYHTLSANAVAGISDTNGWTDIVYRNMTTGVNKYASTSYLGTTTGSHRSEDPTLSADGSRLTFVTYATNIVYGVAIEHGPYPTAVDIYATTLATGANQLVTGRTYGVHAGFDRSYQPDISDDGTRVGFVSGSAYFHALDGNNSTDVFVRDTSSATTMLATVNAAGTSAGSNGGSQFDLSGNGRYVAFYSNSFDLVPNDTNFGTGDIFRRDLLAGTTIVLSTNSAGTGTANGAGSDPSISADGNRIAFRNTGTNLVPGMTDANFFYDAFFVDVLAGVKRLVSRNSNATGAGNDGVEAPYLSASGNRIAYMSSATDHLAGSFDFNGSGDDAYAYSVVADSNLLVSARAADLRSGSFGSAQYPSIDASGNRIAFQSAQRDLVPLAYASFTTQVYVFEASTGTQILATPALSGNAMSNSTSHVAQITPDGRYVVYKSNATNLTANDTNGNQDIFRRDLLLGVTVLASPNSSGANGGNGYSGGNVGDEGPRVSDDGNFIVFKSDATDLVAGDANGDYDIFVRDVAAGATILVSRNGATPANNSSDEPAIAGNGSVVTYESLATNLVAGATDANGAADVFVAFRDPIVAPTIVGMHFDGSSWSAAFRTAAGNTTFGYPAQTGAGQLTSMPWSTINAIYVQFSEPVTVTLAQVGVRGINVPNYPIASVAMVAPSIAKIILAGSIDTDRIVLDLDGDSGAPIVDSTGKALVGSWTEGVSTFPTSGAAGVDFLYRFVVAVGDANRNGQLRNTDVNQVRNQLFIDVGQVGYSIFADIDGNGLSRNADLNATRNHLFVDPPAGPGPLGASGRRTTQRRPESGRGPTAENGAAQPALDGRPGNRTAGSREWDSAETLLRAPVRLPVGTASRCLLLDDFFADLL